MKKHILPPQGNQLRLNSIIHSSFNKVKLKERTDEVLEELFQRRAFPRSKTDNDTEEALKHVEKELAARCAKINKEKLKKKYLE